MREGVGKKQDEKGLSARYLVLVFLMGVGACAVFFSLGFLVGYNERSSKTVATTEQVTTSNVIPPTINPPLEAARPSDKEPPPERISEGAPPSKTVAGGGPPAVNTSTRASIAPKSSSRTETAAAPSPGASVPVSSGFTVQVAASRDKRDAGKLVKELKSRGFAVFVVTPEFAHAGDDLYRVQVGPFATREEAEKVRARIAKEGFKPFIRH